MLKFSRKETNAEMMIDVRENGRVAFLRKADISRHRAYEIDEYSPEQIISYFISIGYKIEHVYSSSRAPYPKEYVLHGFKSDDFAVTAEVSYRFSDCYVYPTKDMRALISEIANNCAPMPSVDFVAPYLRKLGIEAKISWDEKLINANGEVFYLSKKGDYWFAVSINKERFHQYPPKTKKRPPSEWMLRMMDRNKKS